MYVAMYVGRFLACFLACGLTLRPVPARAQIAAMDVVDPDRGVKVPVCRHPEAVCPWSAWVCVHPPCPSTRQVALGRGWEEAETPMTQDVAEDPETSTSAHSRGYKRTKSENVRLCQCCACAAFGGCVFPHPVPAHAVPKKKGGRKGAKGL